jgi:hypothetical protein
MASDAQYWGQLKTFESALRKPGLIPFGLFSPNDNISFVAGIGGNTPLFPTGVTNGVVATPSNTFVFSAPPSELVINGLSLFPPNDFTVVGVTVTLPFVLQTGDKIYALP